MNGLSGTSVVDLFTRISTPIQSRPLMPQMARPDLPAVGRFLLTREVATAVEAGGDSHREGLSLGPAGWYGGSPWLAR